MAKKMFKEKLAQMQSWLCVNLHTTVFLWLSWETKALAT